jgi:hypothetical protein
MIKRLKTSKQSVELTPVAAPPSRIRREPPPLPKRVKPQPIDDVEERETWMVVLGIVLFALAITIIIFGASDYTSR